MASTTCTNTNNTCYDRIPLTIGTQTLLEHVMDTTDNRKLTLIEHVKDTTDNRNPNTNRTYH